MIFTVRTFPGSGAVVTDRSAAKRRNHINIASMGGTAFMAYYTGVSSIQQPERAVLSAKQGVFSGGSFIATLQEQIRGGSESQGIADVDNMTQEEAYMQHLKEKYAPIVEEKFGGGELDNS